MKDEEITAKAETGELTWQRAFVLSQEGSASRQRVIAILAKVIAILLVFLVAAGFGMSMMIGNQNQIEDNQKLGRAQRQQFSAETLYLECNPETPVPVTDPERQRICAGYSTMAEALQSERERGS